jgi:hypothetical protein
MEMQKALLRDCGFEPRPLSVRHLLFESGWRGLMDRRNLIMAQWIEMRGFRWRVSYPRLSLRGLLVFLFYLLVLKLARAVVIYVVHDHAVHDTAGFGRRVSRWLIGLCRRIADYRVVHDPQCVALYDATYLPHPLFWDFPGAAGLPSRKPAPLTSMRCAMLGAIRPYKAIDTILEVWPRGRELTIAGRVQPDLLAHLSRIIVQRDLGRDVVLDPTHQSDEAFAERLGACDVLILPHASNTALVSGAFFEAVGRVPWLVARRSSFIDWAARHFSQVLAFDSPVELSALLTQIERTGQSTPVNLADVREIALQHFGWRQCRETWGEFLAGVSMSHTLDREHQAGGVTGSSGAVSADARRRKAVRRLGPHC